jgi:hypothetical protein
MSLPDHVVRFLNLRLYPVDRSVSASTGANVEQVPGIHMLKDVKPLAICCGVVFSLDKFFKGEDFDVIFTVLTNPLIERGSMTDTCSTLVAQKPFVRGCDGPSDVSDHAVTSVKAVDVFRFS